MRICQSCESRSRPAGLSNTQGGRPACLPVTTCALGPRFPCGRLTDSRGRCGHQIVRLPASTNTDAAPHSHCCHYAIPRLAGASGLCQSVWLGPGPLSKLQLLCRRPLPLLHTHLATLCPRQFLLCVRWRPAWRLPISAACSRSKSSSVSFATVASVLRFKLGYHGTLIVALAQDARRRLSGLGSRLQAVRMVWLCRLPLRRV